LIWYGLWPESIPEIEEKERKKRDLLKLGRKMRRGWVMIKDLLRV
jgi:hypothetical protein